MIDREVLALVENYGEAMFARGSLYEYTEQERDVCDKRVAETKASLLAHLTALASQEGAQAGEVVFIQENALERLARSTSGYVLCDVARERRGDAARKCTIPLYTTPPAPDDAVRAAPEGWCQPMRSGEHTPRQFIVRFDDQDRGDAVFDNEDEAYEFWERANFAWNCYLFGAMPLRARKGGAR